MSGNQTPLNPDALAAAINAAHEAVDWQLVESDRADTEEPLEVSVMSAVSAYLAVAHPVVTGEQVNLAGWTCDGIHEPGSYATCEDCRGACDDLANFYNQMRRTPNASGPWTYRPEVPGA